MKTTDKLHLQAIAEWQADETVHPLTCGNDSSHILKGEIINSTYATQVVLKCPNCTYVQAWIPPVVIDSYYSRQIEKYKENSERQKGIIEGLMTALKAPSGELRYLVDLEQKHRELRSIAADLQASVEYAYGLLMHKAATHEEHSQIDRILLGPMAAYKKYERKNKKHH